MVARPAAATPVEATPVEATTAGLPQPVLPSAH
jgi:hypothetical protein